ncbi:right-handed parallel beta-helix repeat-containing protein, partial [bacterium]|nr:right-handed parallel beta-helix repeat-containing protein [bacterium]
DGSILTNPSHGIYMESDSNTVAGFVIRNFTGSAVRLREAYENLIFGNFIGLDVDGATVQANTVGISFNEGANGNIVGGRYSEQINVISGNGAGITFTNSDSNLVIGNYIGTDASGRTALGNTHSGVTFGRFSSSNVIGGTLEGEGNIISGNGWDGVNIQYEEVSNNQVIGNLIGTDITGQLPLPNAWNGVTIASGAHSNIIGPGNTIRFNTFNGVLVSGVESKNNQITQNSISHNIEMGIKILDNANVNMAQPEITALASVTGRADPNSTVEIFSDSSDQGMKFEATVLADGNGDFYWAGTPSGPYVTATATDEDGNTSEFSEPVLTGNTVVINTNDSGPGSLRWAIEQANLSSIPDSIYFNIPVADDGFNGSVWRIDVTSSLPWLTDDGTVIDGASQTVNHGDTNPDGPEIMIAGVESSSVIDGIQCRSANNVISNLIISNFSGYGIQFYSDQAHDNTVVSNYIGTNEAGDDTLGNYVGIFIDLDAYANVIGGEREADGNLISCNLNTGIAIYKSNYNKVSGNKIGSDVSGSNALGSQKNGILINGNSQLNIIGGPGIEGNLISGNEYQGIKVYDSAVNTVIVGNVIGLNEQGDSAVPNGVGINVQGDSRLTVIGDTLMGMGNVVSGNNQNGIYLHGIDSTRIVNNLIGTDVSGTIAIPNEYNGIFIYWGASHNIIGGMRPVEANVISGNQNAGIAIMESHSDSNMVMGNFIGTDKSGSVEIANGAEGVGISYGAQHNQIGPGNTICFNKWVGVQMNHDSTRYNTIVRNSIHNNVNEGILLRNGANDEILPPVISSALELEISGQAGAGDIVEVFADSSDEGQIYLGRATANASGEFSVSLSEASTLENITATATDTDGNTSAFSTVITSVKASDSSVPMQYTLFQNYPNPFNPETHILFQIPRSTMVVINIFDVRGRLVATPVDRQADPGVYNLMWNGRDHCGEPVASGLYFIHMKCDEFQQIRKAMLIR